MNVFNNTENTVTYRVFPNKPRRAYFFNSFPGMWLITVRGFYLRKKVLRVQFTVYNKDSMRALRSKYSSNWFGVAVWLIIESFNYSSSFLYSVEAIAWFVRCCFTLVFWSASFRSSGSSYRKSSPFS